MPDAGGFTMREADAGDGAPARERPNQRDKVLQALIQADVTFWRDMDGNAFASVPGAAGTLARYRVKGRTFPAVARRIFGRLHTRAIGGATVPGSISDTAWAEAVCQLEAIALDGPQRATEVRSIEAESATWIDLGCDRWRVARIDANGWRIVGDADVPLIRAEAMRALPEPVRDPDALSNLRALCNVARDDDFRLIVAWLVAALHPSGPYPVLAIDGEQGCGKSTTCRVLRRLIDPNKADLRAPPRNEDDLIVAANSSRVVALDNVSFIEADIADALCRLATGAGMSKRTLYTDGDEHILAVSRPVLLNGIPSLLARGDLADRALAITLPTIPDGRRRPEADVWTDFDRAAPGILALLLDGLATALRRMPDLHLPSLPRMADFAKLACAAASAFDWTDAEMLAAIEGNRADAVRTVVENDAVASAVRDLIAHDGKWTGKASELLAKLNETAPLALQREQGWPKDGTRLSGRLRRAAPALRRLGLDVTVPENGGRAGRVLTISRASAAASGRERWNADNAVRPIVGVRPSGEVEL